ncbi:hypothetical protein, partial [Candidatus Protofrankia californiensis]|uniref:hypothetical protein n=2 Tax=Frankiaceae TaxID=74712 RepID=UPI0019D2A824
MSERTAISRSREEPVRRLMKECLDRSDEARNRDLPIVLLLGPPGIGRSAVLDEIERWCAAVPHVRLNLGGTGRQPAPGRDISPAREILVRTAFGLAGKVPGYRRITFDRLYTCLLILASELEMNDRIQTLYQITRLLRDRTWAERNRDDIIRIVSPVLASLELPDVASAAVTVLASMQWRARLGGRRTWPFQRAERSRRTAEPISPDALADLVALQGADDESRQEVERLLVKMFLADLYDSFAAGRQAGSDLFNCVLLLDNVHHSPGGREFLHLLVEERHQRASEGAGTCDPLVVIAASRGWNPVRDGTPGGRIRPLDAAGYADWARGRRADAHEAGSWWYRWNYPTSRRTTSACWSDAQTCPTGGAGWQRTSIASPTVIQERPAMFCEGYGSSPVGVHRNRRRRTAAACWKSKAGSAGPAPRAARSAGMLWTTGSPLSRSSSGRCWSPVPHHRVSSPVRYMRRWAGRPISSIGRPCYRIFRRTCARGRPPAGRCSARCCGACCCRTCAPVPMTTGTAG